MSYTFFVLPKNYEKMREEIFIRMQDEKLLGACMHSVKNPSIDKWLDISAPHKGWLLCCVANHAKQHTTNDLCGIAWFEPWHGRTWKFDFTAFRAHFSQAPIMSKGALAWMFEHAPCDSVIGLCPVSNAHAWRLASRSGFETLGKIPNACFQARKSQYEDGIFVLASKQSFTL